MSASMSLLGDIADQAALDVEDELPLAERVLAETADRSIRDREDMIRAAVGLRIRLACLVAAVRAARGEGQ